MIIHSIRLKNIKSYGEGLEGNGITISFQPGVNRIAGLNGHGKTTIIESIGYALFLAEPQFYEKFAIATYFLSTGKKEGEIDITFGHKGETYRIERGVGTASKRRSKVVLTSDSSLCAENDEEVANFICKLLDLPDASRLSEMFAKLIGVKQGRLTWPFDSKASDAKKFFEPLLEVEVFRQCFDSLAPVKKQFEDNRNDSRIKKGGFDERIRERSDSPEKVKEAEKAVSALGEAVARCEKARDEALDELRKQEVHEKAFQKAAANKNTAVITANTAKVNREEAQKRVSESEKAVETVTASKPAFDAYKKAESSLKELDGRRVKRDGLQKKRTTAELDKQDRTAKAKAARETAELFATQKNEKDAEREALAKKTDPIRKAFDSGKKAYEKSQQAAEDAELDRNEVKAWVSGFPALSKRIKSLADGIVKDGGDIADWDPAKLASAKKEEKEAAKALTEARKQLEKTRERRDTLADQMKQVSGGTCPFLKEACRQFDPAKVKTDLSKLTTEITALEKAEKAALALQEKAQGKLEALVEKESQRKGKIDQVALNLGSYKSGLGEAFPSTTADAVKRLLGWSKKAGSFSAKAAAPGSMLAAGQVPSLQEAFKAFIDEAKAWWAETEPVIAEQLRASKHEQTERTKTEAYLDTAGKQLEKLLKEITTLEKSAREKRESAGNYEKEALGFKELVDGLDLELKPYAALDAEIETTIKRRDDNKSGHESYLTAKGLSDELGDRRERLEKRTQEEGEAGERLAHAEEAFKTAYSAFKEEALNAARTEYGVKLSEATAASTDLNHAKSDKATQDTRFKEWEEAIRERGTIDREIARNDAAIELTELARKTLKSAAPAVAQHLCNRIASRAQAIFNRINPDPVELAWDAENYSLRITPGERRFAMLSGGEQTKLALSVTLSMVEEFSGLRFCIFDEPTYGVDAESRGKLADAILEVQMAAGLDQLLLVSHDDAFEGKVEHAILLKKSAASGTAVMQAQ